MDILKDTQKVYVEAQQELDKIEARIGQRRKQIERLEKKYDKKREENWWIKLLVAPILTHLKERYPDLYLDDTLLSPMGLRSAVHTWFYDADDWEATDKILAMLTLTPGDLSKGELWYDTGEVEDDYPEGSIGFINGMNRVSKPLENMEQIYNRIDEQIKQKRDATSKV